MSQPWAGILVVGGIVIVAFVGLLLVARDQEKDDDAQDEHGF